MRACRTLNPPLFGLCHETVSVHFPNHVHVAPPPCIITITILQYHPAPRLSTPPHPAAPRRTPPHFLHLQVRWFKTCINQPEFLAVLGTSTLLMGSAVPAAAPAKAEKPAAAEKAPKEKKEKAPPAEKAPKVRGAAVAAPRARRVGGVPLGVGE